MSFELSLGFVARWEQGRSDDVDDPGGRTFVGITEQSFANWLGVPLEGCQDVWTATPDQVISFYRRYWQNSGGEGFDAIDPRLGLLMFDAAVQHSPHESVRLLQTALKGLKVDGQYGDMTHDRLMDVWNQTPDAFLHDLVDARKDYYIAIALKPTMTKFLGGWLNRVADCVLVANCRPEDLLPVVQAAHSHAHLPLALEGIP